MSALRGQRGGPPKGTNSGTTSVLSYGQVVWRSLTLVILVAGAVGTYFVLRYAGAWAENDTAVFARVVAGLQRAGQLEYPGAYPHGYAYPVWVTAISGITGLSTQDLVQLVTPIVGSLLLGILGYVAFRRLLGSSHLALMAASILFLVPELVFSVARGNHEKLTIALVLMAVLAQFMTFIELARFRWRPFAGWVVSYYLTAFTLVSLNALFGSSFIVASTLTFVLLVLVIGVSRRANRLKQVATRLLLVVSTSWALVALVMLFVYPLAAANLRLLDTAAERLSALFLSVAPESDPYQVIATDWANPAAYAVISSFRWVLFASSFVAWLLLARALVRSLEHAPLNQILLFSFYGAFGFQVAAAIPVDFLGLYAGSNLQVRLYTYFVLFSAPMLAFGLDKLRRQHGHAWRRPMMGAIAATVIAAFAGLSLFKATLDPAVSNRWSFYRQQEVMAIRFWDNIQYGDALWIGPEDRAFMAYMLEEPLRGDLPNAFVTSRFGTVPVTTALMSPIVRENAVAWGAGTPAFVRDQRVYDNGFSQLVRREATTPFMR